MQITGQRFGKLIAIKIVEPLPNQSKKYKYWLCKCECGGEKTCRESELKYKNGVRSCGCLQREKAATDYKGKRFGMLVAIKPTEERKYGGAVVWEFKCDCGIICCKAIQQLQHELPNCGCMSYEKSRNKGLKAIAQLISECVYDTNVRNLRSKKLRNDNTSGVRGVYWAKWASLWYGEITFKKKRYRLGYFKSKDDAVKIRKHAEEMMFEPFLKWYEEWIKRPKAIETTEPAQADTEVLI